MQEYYKILGVNENASNEEIDAAYAQLKRKYSRERFYEGEAGNEAARNLTKLETAYSEIMRDRNRQKASTEDGDLSKVESLIREGKYSEAQAIMDDFDKRTAEWHYLQSVLFYKKSWLNESKKQLEIACEMEPENEKYRQALNTLTAKMDFDGKKSNAQNDRVNAQQTTTVEERQMGGSACGGMLDCCATWCCMNMLCNGCCR